MDFVKKNLLSLICATIALIAIISTFFPLGGYFTTLKATLTARTADVKKMELLIKPNQPRVLPAIDLRNLQARPLEQFPTQKVIDWGMHQAGDLKGAASQMFAKAVDINSNNIPTRTKRAVLSEGVLPIPANSGPSQINFRNAYDDLMRSFAPPVAATPGATSARPPASAEEPQAPGKLVERLRATKPVTEEEIKAEHERIVADVKTHEQKAQNQIVNQAALDEELATRTDSLGLKMHKDRAKNFMMYLDSNGLYYNNAMYESKRAGTPPTIESIWYAQMQAWLQEDIVQAIIETNGADATVQTSVVKRLSDMHLFDGSGEVAGTGSGSSAAATPAASGSGGKYGASLTGRASNTMYDVMRFSFVAYVDATKMLQFNTELGHNRFINVTRMDILAHDSAADQNAGYYYGGAPMLKVGYECEALFLRDWTKKWMPKEIKDRLGVTDDRSSDTH